MEIIKAKADLEAAESGRDKMEAIRKLVVLEMVIERLEKDDDIRQQYTCSIYGLNGIYRLEVDSWEYSRKEFAKIPWYTSTTSTTLKTQTTRGSDELEKIKESTTFESRSRTCEVSLHVPYGAWVQMGMLDIDERVKTDYGSWVCVDVGVFAKVLRAGLDQSLFGKNLCAAAFGTEGSFFFGVFDEKSDIDGSLVRILSNQSQTDALSGESGSDESGDSRDSGDSGESGEKYSPPTSPSPLFKYSSVTSPSPQYPQYLKSLKSPENVEKELQTSMRQAFAVGAEFHNIREVFSVNIGKDVMKGQCKFPVTQCQECHRDAGPGFGRCQICMQAVLCSDCIDKSTHGSKRDHIMFVEDEICRVTMNVKHDHKGCDMNFWAIRIPLDL